MARFQFEVDEDFYFVLNVTRDAERSEIRQQYRKLARDWHPDVFVEETKFDPQQLSVKQLQQYLQKERVGFANLIEKSELETKAWETHRRTQNVNRELEERRMEIQDRFALLNEAYNTLYDDEKRRMYNLSGDWGIPGVPGKTRKKEYDMGDREEAARVRARAEAAQRSPLQEKVYRQYSKEKQEKEAKEAELQKQRQAKQQQKEEELRRKKELEPKLTLEQEAEVRAANQEKIKAMWGNAFNKMFGVMEQGKK